MRHLAVGQPCPIDAVPVSRSHCSGCPAFVSFRTSNEVATVGCAWGDDVVAWLRREMAPIRRPISPRMAPGAGRRTGPRAPRTRRRPGLAPGTSFGLFVAALGVGLVLSALERPE